MIIILIAGASGSGKSRLAKLLLEQLNGSGGNHLLMTMDDYFHEIPDGIDINWFRTNTQFDDPKLLELSLLQEHLVALDSGETITKPVFDFHTNRRLRTEVIVPPDVLIVEGLFALYFAQKHLPKELTSLTVFVETNSYLTLLNRRAQRDIKERGRPNEIVVRQQEHKYVGPAFFGIIVSSKTCADIVVDNSEESGVAAHGCPLARGVSDIIAELETKMAEQHLASPS